jgi:membrane fusion protein (multidrug efflux system)
LVSRYPARTDQTRVEHVSLTLSDGTSNPYASRLRVIRRKVGPTSGNPGLQLQFANRELTLRPGQNGRVRLLIGTERGALLVPQRACRKSRTPTAWPLSASDNTVSVRRVKAGRRVDAMWVIDAGLQARRFAWSPTGLRRSPRDRSSAPGRCAHSPTGNRRRRSPRADALTIDDG